MADFSGGKWADKNGPTTGTDFYVVDGGDVLKVQLDGWSQGQMEAGLQMMPLAESLLE